ncbi:TRAP transporter small permease [Shumkonia mesophila]|uniref:TRAP transporter small permease n=1 Tax=Shumkonia mesophila TaxID=2838854 RepID=UPI002934FB88|nr:TRAP transporter small permease subunit [Shumkonia mesophila]
MSDEPGVSSLFGGFGRACDALEWVAIRLLLILTLLLVIQVGARNFFSLGLTWADELSRYCGLGIVFLTAPVLVRRNMQVRVTLFVEMMPPVMQAIAELLASIAVNLFCLAFMISAYMFMSHAWSFVTPAIGMPNIVFYLPALLGILFFWIAAAEQTIDCVRRIKSVRDGEAR